MRYDVFKAFAAVTFTALAAYFDRLLLPLVILLIVMSADYASGLCKAFVKGELSSRVGITGIVKKLCYFLAVLAGAGVDYIMFYGEAAEFSVSSPVACLVAFWLILNELISILENINEIGVPLPDFLVKLTDKLLSKSGDKEI